MHAEEHSAVKFDPRAMSHECWMKADELWCLLHDLGNMGLTNSLPR